MLKSTSTLALAMTASMARRRSTTRHCHIAAGRCSPQLCYVVCCRVDWPPRRQDASPIADAQCVVAIHRIYDRLAITFIIRVAYHAFALNKHARLALFNVQTTISTKSSPVSRSFVPCLGWWRVEAEHGTKYWLFLRSTDWCRQICVFHLDILGMIL